MPRKDQFTTADFMDWSENLRVLNSLYEEKEYTYYMLFLIGTHFGLRISDIKRITWDDLIRKERIVLNEKKRGKRRNIEVSHKIKERALDIYGKQKPSGKYVVSLKSDSSINKKLKRLKKKYKIDIGNFSTHTFRKTFGRYIWEKDGRSDRALIMLNEILNHSNIQTTKRYIGIRQEEIDQVYKMVAES